jgi:hypothetical protein
MEIQTGVLIANQSRQRQLRKRSFDRLARATEWEEILGAVRCYFHRASAMFAQTLQAFVLPVQVQRVQGVIPAAAVAKRLVHADSVTLCCYCSLVLLRFCNLDTCNFPTMHTTSAARARHHRSPTTTAATHATGKHAEDPLLLLVVGEGRSGTSVILDLLSTTIRGGGGAFSIFEPYHNFYKSHAEMFDFKQATAETANWLPGGLEGM